MKKNTILSKLKVWLKHSHTFSCCCKAGFSSFFGTSWFHKKLVFYTTLSLLAFGQAPIYGQLVGGAAVKAGFGIDGDVYANLLQFGNLAGPSNTDDWFNSTYPGDGRGVIKQTDPIPATPNEAFSFRQSITALNSPYPYPLVPGVNDSGAVVDYLWLDAVYGRDNYVKGGSAEKSYFAGSGDKNSDNPSTWSIGTSGSVPQKDDLIDVYAHLRGEGPRIPFTPPGNTDPRPFTTLWAYAGASLVVTNGNKHVDFEFFRTALDEVSDLSVPGATGPDGGRTAWTFNPDGSVATPGTIIVSVDYTNGGTVPQVRVRVWMDETVFNNYNNSAVARPFTTDPGTFEKGTGSLTFGYGVILPNVGTTAIWGRVNNNDTTLGPPWGTFEGSTPNAVTHYQALQFVEIGINLTAFGLDARGSQDPCSNILGSLLVKTRSSGGGPTDSTAFGSELKDFAGPFLFGNTGTPPNITVAAKTICNSDNPVNLTTGTSVTPDGGPIHYFTSDGDNNDAEGVYDVEILNPASYNASLGTTTIYVRSEKLSNPGCYGIAQFDVTVNPGATANANIDQTICAGSTVQLAGSVGGGASSGTWSSSGTGTFAPNATTLNAVYTPSAADIAGGSVTLTLTTNNPDGPCPAVSDFMVVTINPGATANANIDQTICAGSTVQLAGSVGGGASSGTWSSSGTGTFAPNATTLNAVYTPSAADIAGGSVTLTLTTNDPTGPCQAVSDMMVTFINPGATANANIDQTICAGSTVQLAGSVGGGASSGTWSSSGTGTFAPNATTLNAVYTPSAADIAGGSVTLTLTTNNPDGPCPAVSDFMVVTINPGATANANIDQTICAGSTVQLAGSVGGGASSGTWSSSGTGTFAPNATTLNAVYTPSAADIAGGSVTLTLTTNNPDGPCPAVSDFMVVTINPGATANANIDQTICAGSTVQLAGSVGGGASSGTWSSSGTGTFAPNATTLNAVYTPSAADIAGGSVTLTLTTNNPDGPCPAVSDFMVVTINPGATANANIDQTICAGSTVQLAGSVGGGASSGTWSSSGTGTFAPNATTLNAVYTPSAADIAGGSVTLTLTTNDPTGPCQAVSDMMVTFINPGATANANIDQTICAGSTVQLAGSVGGGASSGTWSSSGTGTFAPNATTLNAVYTPSAADIAGGSVTLTLTTNNPDGPCPAVSDFMVVTINPGATANANIDQTICAGSTVQLAGSVGGGASSGTWSSSGTGTFAPNATTLNAVYTPSAADIAGGSVTLTLTTNDPTGPCQAVSDMMVTFINLGATANANIDQTICAGSTVQLAGSVGGGASSGTWSSSGTGTFAPNATTLNAVYTPSAADIAGGSVTLTLTTNNPDGPCPAVSDFMVVTINPGATANANIDQTICAGSTVQLAGSVGGGASSGTWSSSGTGTFAPNATTLNAVYTPSAADIAGGSVTLTLTTNNPDGPCPAVSDFMVVTINPGATANANIDQTICAGSTVQLAGSVGGGASSGTWSSSGTGTFAPNATTLNAVYTPSAADIAGGSVTLTLTTNNPDGPCPAVSDFMVVTINPGATANANIDQTICAGSTVQLAGSVGGGASSGTWSSSGTGTFAPNATTLNAVYTPSAADIAGGSVTLTLTTNDPTGPCQAVSDMMVTFINPGATANANIDQTICAGSTVQLAGSVGGGASSGTWSSSGTGTFAPNATTLNAVYTPSAADIAGGSVTLTLTTNNPDGPCPAVSDFMVVTINPGATANANIDQTICAGSTVQLAGSVGGGASSGTWSSSGTGTFAPNATTLNAVYTPSAADIAGGSVILTLTTNNPDGPCPAVSDFMVVTINPGATANANIDQTICAGSTVQLAGSVGGGASSGTWSSSGTGTFAPNATTLNAVYTPSAADIAGGSVTLTLTTNNPDGPCPAVSDFMVVTINPGATANANIDQTICAGSTVQLAGSVGGGASSGTWSSSGTGTFAPNATTLNAVYTPSAADIAGGSVTLTLTTNNPDGPCPAVSDFMVVTINPNPICDITGGQTICSGGTSTFTATAGMKSYSWTGPNGFTSSDQTITVSMAGTYQVTITNSSDCSSTCSRELIVESCISEECTLGYWKNHTDRWCSTYRTCDLFGDVFKDAPAALKNITLLEALNLGGGGNNLLARQGVAALLNACTLKYSDPYSTPQAVIDAVNSAYRNNQAGAMGAILGKLNEKDNCTLGGTSATSASNCTSLTPTAKAADPAGFTASPVPFKGQLNIRYNFDYVSDVKIEVFNSNGSLVYSKLDSNSYLNKEIALNLNVNRGQEQVFIVKLTTNRGSSTKKVMSSQ
ncbi:hypothetical protein ACMDB5_14300 [Flavobacterium sp. W1B]|uniref:hypothetical protein n=1 Tax=Flavobacterium sp. W1B TaxID=3394146 RepID=UPI0039BC9571